MYEQSSNFCLNTLSSIINEKIDFYIVCKKKRVIKPNPNDKNNKNQSTLSNSILQGNKTFEKASSFLKMTPSSETLEKVSKTKKLYSEELMLIVPKGIVFIGEKLQNGIKRKFTFENIKSISTQRNPNQSEITFKLKEPLKSQKKLEYTFIILCDIEYVLKQLNNKYQIYCVKHYGNKNTLSISSSVNKKQSSENVISPTGQPSQEIQQNVSSIQVNDGENNQPQNTNIITLKDYQFVLNNKYVPSKHKENIFILNNIQNDNNNNIESPSNNKYELIPPKLSIISVEVLREQPIENISENPMNRSMKYTALNALDIYMKNNFPEKTNYWLEPLVYITKPSIENDSSLWKVIKFQLKTKHDSNNCGYNILFFYLRRLFIPPLYESYNDFIIILKETYFLNSDNTNISDFALNSVNECVESINPVFLQEKNEVTNRLIQSKIDSYLIDLKSFNFYYKFLCLYGNESYKLALDFKLKLALLYEKYQKESIYEDLRIMDEIANAYKLIDNKDIDRLEYLKKVKFSKIEDIIENRVKKIDEYFNSTEKQTPLLYRNKIANYLGFVIMSKYFAGSLLEKLLSLNKRVPEFAEEFNPILHYLLNIQIIKTNNNEIEINKSIDYIVKNAHQIEQITFNERLMCLFISSGILKEVEHIDSELTIYQFLEYILKNNFSLKLLKAVYTFFNKIKTSITSKMSEEDDEDRLINVNSNNTYGLIKYSKMFIPIFSKLYSDFDYCASVIILSCKCLIILTFLDIQNKELLANDEFYTCLYHYFSSNNEQILYYSIQLFNEITPSSFDMTKIIETNPGFLFKMINIIKGTGICDCRYNPQLIYYVLKLLHRLIRDNSYIKQLLLEANNRKFVKYLIQYIYAYDEFVGVDNLSKSYYLPILTAVYDILRLITTKNTEIRRYLHKNYHLIKLINSKSAFYSELIKLVESNSPDEKKKIVTAFFIALIVFLNEFIGQDISMVSNVKLEGIELLKVIFGFGEFLGNEKIDIESKAGFQGKRQTQENLDKLNEQMEICKELVQKLTS